MFGADGWSYADVLPYFLKSEYTEEKDFIESGGIMTILGPRSVCLTSTS